MFPAGYGARGRGAAVGTGANTNLPLPAGCGHEAIFTPCGRWPFPLIHEVQPDVIIIADGGATMLIRWRGYPATGGDLCRHDGKPMSTADGARPGRGHA